MFISSSILQKDNVECISLQCTSYVYTRNCLLLQCTQGKAENRLSVE